MIYLSGGSSNTDIAASLGGAIATGTLEATFRVTTPYTGIAGVTIRWYSIESSTSLAFSYADLSLQLGSGSAFFVGTGGDFEIADDRGNFCAVTIAPGELPTSDIVVELPSQQIPNVVLFDAIPPSRSDFNSETYRCFYLKNDFGYDLQNLQLWVDGKANNKDFNDKVLVSWDLQSPGDGVISGVANPIADETIAPAYIVFRETVVRTYDAGGTETSKVFSPVYLAQLKAGDAMPFWVQRQRLEDFLDAASYPAPEFRIGVFAERAT